MSDILENKNLIWGHGVHVIVYSMFLKWGYLHNHVELLNFVLHLIVLNTRKVLMQSSYCKDMALWCFQTLNFLSCYFLLEEKAEAQLIWNE